MNQKTIDKISKIKIDKDLCIGAAICVQRASESFELNSEGKAVYVDSGENKEKIIKAIQDCPVKAIIALDENNNEIEI